MHYRTIDSAAAAATVSNDVGSSGLRIQDDEISIESTYQSYGGLQWVTYLALHENLHNAEPFPIESSCCPGNRLDKNSVLAAG